MQVNFIYIHNIQNTIFNKGRKSRDNGQGMLLVYRCIYVTPDFKDKIECMIYVCQDQKLIHISPSS
jgi:hypothetical protein